MATLSRTAILALARAFDRNEAGEPWARGERRLKARLARRRSRGTLYLTRADLRWIGEWKSPRIRPQIARNTEAGVRGATEAAFLARSDSTRLRLLLGLRGVGTAVASVVLHFAEPRRYPIYDVRVLAALRRIGVRRGFPPNPAGWAAYAAALRGLATRHHVSLRTLDKALWLLGGDEPRSPAAAGRGNRVLPWPRDHSRGEPWGFVTTSMSASSRSRSTGPRPSTRSTRRCTGI